MTSTTAQAQEIAAFYARYASRLQCIVSSRVNAPAQTIEDACQNEDHRLQLHGGQPQAVRGTRTIARARAQARQEQDAADGRRTRGRASAFAAYAGRAASPSLPSSCRSPASWLRCCGCFGVAPSRLATLRPLLSATSSSTRRDGRLPSNADPSLLRGQTMVARDARDPGFDVGAGRGYPALRSSCG